MKSMKSYKDIDAYIAGADTELQPKLKEIRAIIKNLVPDATEKISYGIPTFVLNGNLVHFGGFKTHIGFFPGAEGVATFEKDLKDYDTSKGTIRFPLDEPLPKKLITEIVKFRVDQNKNRKK